MRTLRFVLLASLAATPLAAQQTDGFDLSIANIMRGPELYGRSPQNVSWTPDGRWIYFRWVEPGTDWRAPMEDWRVRPARDARPERVTRAHMDSVAPLLVSGGSLSPDRRLRAVSSGGDLYVIDQQRGTARRLTQTNAAAANPQFSADGRRIYYISDNNLFSIELDGGLLRQHTDIRTGPAPRDSAPPVGQRGALQAQQRELFEAVRDQERRDSLQRAERTWRDSLRILPVHLERRERVAALRVAPSGRGVIVTTITPAEGVQQTRIPNYVTLSGYTEEMTVRPKVGDAQSQGRIGFMTLPDAQITWLDVMPEDTSRAGAQVQVLDWNAAGTQALVRAVSRDFKTRWLHVVNAEGGAVRTVDVLRDTAWVAG
ncbi:MAG TPA: DPP IV N-terminal domain-containing protein, partial [Gemmatimonadaceae bacterium]|nr:DPP IV N-terminal domain-containing protein [Gemmatimonadaceae bacterium]